MKSENDRLKEIFAKNLGRRTNSPDFNSMWQKAAEGSKERGFLAWRVAASLVFIVATTTLAILNRQRTQEYREIQISSWIEPTKGLVPAQSDVQVSGITHWTSPTSYLLPKNDQLIK
jgi:hypothetical protein